MDSREPIRGEAMRERNQPDIVFVLRELRSLLGNHEGASLAIHVDEELQKLTENRFYLVVLGQFKRGKTTFLNALLGEYLLPVGVLPLTAVVTLIYHGLQRNIRVVFNDDRIMEIQPNELADFVAEQKNPGNVKQVRYVEIAHPSPILRDGLVLVDTPGIGSLFQHNTELTKQFIPKVDAAVLIVSTDPPITQTEYEFLDEVVRHVEKVFVVLNKADLLHDGDLEEMLKYTKSAIGSKLSHGDLHVHPLSAFRALEGRGSGDQVMVARSGMLEVERELAAFMRNERTEVLQRQSRRRADNLLAKAHFEAELELKALQMPLADLERRIKEFENQIAQLLKDREVFTYVFHGEVKSIERWIDEESERFAKDEIQSFIQALPLWALEFPDSSFNKFLRPLESKLVGAIVEDFDRWRTQFEPLLLERYDALTARYVQKTNQFIESILKLSQSLFASSVQPIGSIEPIRWQKRFYYNMQNEALFLEFDFLKVLSMLLPRSIVRRWSLKRLLKSVEEKVRPVCNGLKYEYSYSLQETYRHFQSDLNEQMDTIIHEVRSILQQATKLKSATEENLKIRVEALLHRLDRLAELQRLVRMP
jgi:GTPase SAR1 family protein